MKAKIGDLEVEGTVDEIINLSLTLSQTKKEKPQPVPSPTPQKESSWTPDWKARADALIAEVQSGHARGTWTNIMTRHMGAYTSRTKKYLSDQARKRNTSLEELRTIIGARRNKRRKNGWRRGDNRTEKQKLNDRRLAELQRRRVFLRKLAGLRPLPQKGEHY